MRNIFFPHYLSGEPIWTERHNNYVYLYAPCIITGHGLCFKHDD